MATAPAPNVRKRTGLQHVAQGGHATDQQSYIHVPYYSEDPDSNILFVLEVSSISYASWYPTNMHDQLQCLK